MTENRSQKEQLDEEINSFQGIWHGGYYESSPKDPHGWNNYLGIDVRNGYSNQLEVKARKGIIAEEVGTISVLYATYLMTLRGRVNDKTVLEIGPGRGAWTKCILEEGAKLVYALDALSAEHNQFFEYLGSVGEGKVKYIQVFDFSCSGIPDCSIDFVFSFGCFCHISRVGIAQYMESLFQKMKPGSDGFVMISDYNKLSRAFGAPAHSDPDHEDVTPSPGRWFHLGVEWFCELLTTLGFDVLDPDISCCPRDPIVHFRR